MVVEGVCLLVVLIGRLGRHEAVLVLDVFLGVRTKCTAHWFLHLLTFSYMFLNVLTCFGQNSGRPKHGVFFNVVESRDLMSQVKNHQSSRSHQNDMCI